MIRIIISLIVGFVAFFFATMFIGNVLIGLMVGICVGIVLSLLTDKDSIERSRRRRHDRNEEDKENRRWARESYHKERGRSISQYDRKKQEEYDNYNELDVRHIGHKRSKIKKIYGI